MAIDAHFICRLRVLTVEPRVNASTRSFDLDFSHGAVAAVLLLYDSLKY